MVDSKEPAPPQMGRFLVWLGVALMVVLLLFLVVFYYHGHKASLMKNSGIGSPTISTQAHAA